MRYFSAIAGRSAEEAQKIFHPDDTLRNAKDIKAKLPEQSASINALVADTVTRGLTDVSGMRIPIENTSEDRRGDGTKRLPTVRQLCGSLQRARAVHTEAALTRVIT